VLHAPPLRLLFLGRRRGRMQWRPARQHPRCRRAAPRPPWPAWRLPQKQLASSGRPGPGGAHPGGAQIKLPTDHSLIEGGAGGKALSSVSSLLSVIKHMNVRCPRCPLSPLGVGRSWAQRRTDPAPATPTCRCTVEPTKLPFSPISLPELWLWEIAYGHPQRLLWLPAFSQSVFGECWCLTRSTPCAGCGQACTFLVHAGGMPVAVRAVFVVTLGGCALQQKWREWCDTPALRGAAAIAQERRA
jgi:hypothetical protein